MKKSVLTLALALVFARPMKRVVAVITGIILVLASFSAAKAASYNYTTLDYPGATHTEAWDINDAGTIVGVYDNGNDPEIWEEAHGCALGGTTWTSLGFPGAMWTLSWGINNGGSIAGSYVDPGGVSHGFTLSDTIYKLLEPYPGDASEIYAYRINDAGTIVGWASGTDGRSFLLSGMTYTFLDYPGGWFTAHDINNDDTIVGECYDSGGDHGCSLNGTTWTTLDYPEATSTYAWGINDSGTIVGAYKDTSGNTHGFSFDGTTWTTLDYPGATHTEAHGINDKGMIVGMYEDATGTHGFLATPPPILTVILEGTGSGLVVSNPSGISCELDCSEGFTAGTLVTITATLYPGSAFAYWSGGCSGTTNTCVLTVTQDITVTAHFVTEDTKEYNLKVTRIKVHKGDGLVTSYDGNITCGDTCKHKYYKETEVTLNASPFQGSVFKGWKPLSLNCPGTGSCLVNLEKATEVKAIFVGDYRLKIINKSKEGGSGMVTSTPAGISCSTDDPVGCEDLFPYDEEVTLSASADAGSTFIGWRPASKCPGTGDCVVTMDRGRTIKAVFSKQP